MYAYIPPLRNKFLVDSVGSKIHSELSKGIEMIFPTYLQVSRSIGKCALDIIVDSGSVTVVTPSELQYSCYSGNVPGLHTILRVKLLTPLTSGLPFLLCSSFVLTLLIRKRCLIVLLFCSIVLRSQTYLRSKTPDSLLCSISSYCACCAP